MKSYQWKNFSSWKVRDNDFLKKTTKKVQQNLCDISINSRQAHRNIQVIIIMYWGAMFYSSPLQLVNRTILWPSHISTRHTQHTNYKCINTHIHTQPEPRLRGRKLSYSPISFSRVQKISLFIEFAFAASNIF